MIQINLNKTKNKINLTIPLDANIDLTGLLLPLNPTVVNPPPYDLTDYVITGRTNSKLSFITKSFPAGNVIVGTPIIIRGTELYGKIETELNSDAIIYHIYAGDTANRIWVWANASIDGEWWSNSTTYDKITKIRINFKDDSGKNYRNWLTNFREGSALYIDNKDFEDRYGFYTVLAEPVMAEKYAELQVKCDKGNGSFGGGSKVLMRHSTIVGIKYTDTVSETIFEFRPMRELPYADDTVFLLQYLNLIDEPKLDSNLFINRGVNNVFESFRRLKTVANVEELEKTGFGYFNVISSS